MARTETLGSLLRREGIVMEKQIAANAKPTAPHSPKGNPHGALDPDSKNHIDTSDVRVCFADDYAVYLDD